MNCQIFEKRLMDLIEDNVAYDLKDAMMEHVDKCEHCRELYEKEMVVENALKTGMSTEGIYFNSSRGDIMKNIDKNRYSKNPLKKINYHIKKYSGLYAAAAVLIITTSFLVPYLFGGSSKKDMASGKMSTESKSIASKQDAGVEKYKESTPKYELNEAPKNNAEDKALNVVIPEDKNAPVFKKTVLQKNVEPSFNTPIQTSSNKKFEATVEGKGDAAQEEGIAKLFIKDLTTGARWTFEIVQDQQKGEQNTPKYVKWVDDNNFLTIVGQGHGTVTRGGAIYLMNANTGKLVNADIERKIDVSQGSKIEITKVLTIKNNELELEVNVYDDSNLMTAHIEKRTIPFPYGTLKQYVEAAQ